MPLRVTPDGVRVGVPEALAGLVELRGSAVRAYAGEVAQPERALAAAAEAMAGFRSRVVQATDVHGLDPDSILLHAVRESSAARARAPGESGGRLRRVVRRAGSACELVPRLLAARANRKLSHEDAARLDRHLAGCPGCRELRERFRTAENLYAETPGTPLAERDARALLVALAAAGPLVTDATVHTIAQDALALLPAEVVSRPGRARAAMAPTEASPAQSVPEATPPQATPPDTTPPPRTDATPQTRHPDPWPTDPAAADVRPVASSAAAEASAAREGENASANGADASPGSSAARHGGRVGTTPGRVSFARRTVVIRSAIERSGPATAPAPQPPAPEPESSAPRQEPPPAPEPAVPAAPHGEPAWPASVTNPDRLEVPEPPPLPMAPTHAPAPTSDSGPGAPPDSGTLARVVPGILIVMAIGIALLITGIVGVGNTPATTDDIRPPGLGEPTRQLNTPGTPTPPATDAATSAK